MGHREIRPETAAKRLGRRKVDQSAAICWRAGDNGSVDVLLVTSKDTGRWVIPKGNTEKSEPLHRCAQREAWEEAGVTGRIGKKPLGHYSYLKDQKLPRVVSVYPLLVENEVDDFQERDQRTRQWWDVAAAADLVDEPELQMIFRQIDSEAMPKSFQKEVTRVVADRIKTLRRVPPQLSAA